jgi:hypothetical protein
MTPLDNLDRIIDNVSRGMTSAPPAVDVRARVMARIAEKPAASRLWWRLAIAGGSVAALIVAVWSSSLVTQPARTPIVATSTGAASVASNPAPNPTAPPSAPSPLTPARARTSRAPVMTTTLAEQEWRARAIPAIDRLPSAGIAEIQIVPLRITPMVVTAIGDDPNR